MQNAKDAIEIVQHNTFQKKDIKFLLTDYNRPVEFEWQLAAYLYMSNQNNRNRMVLTTKNNFTTEFMCT